MIVPNPKLPPSIIPIITAAVSIELLTVCTDIPLRFETATISPSLGPAPSPWLMYIHIPIFIANIPMNRNAICTIYMLLVFIISSESIISVNNPIRSMFSTVPIPIFAPRRQSNATIIPDTIIPALPILISKVDAIPL